MPGHISQQESGMRIKRYSVTVRLALMAVFCAVMGFIIINCGSWVCETYIASHGVNIGNIQFAVLIADMVISIAYLIFVFIAICIARRLTGGCGSVQSIYIGVVIGALIGYLLYMILLEDPIVRAGMLDVSLYYILPCLGGMVSHEISHYVNDV